MMKLVTRNIPFIIILLTHVSSIGQVDSGNLSEIKVYHKFIDSIDQLGNSYNLGYHTLIEDGVIRRKNDNKIVGGYSISTLSKNDTALKIEYHQGLKISTYKTFYFKYNSLVFATLELRDRKTDLITLYKKEEYYKNNNVILSNVSKNAHNDYQDKKHLQQDGLKFLNDFNKSRKRQ